MTLKPETFLKPIEELKNQNHDKSFLDFNYKEKHDIKLGKILFVSIQCIVIHIILQSCTIIGIDKYL